MPMNMHWMQQDTNIYDCIYKYMHLCGRVTLPDIHIIYIYICIHIYIEICILSIAFRHTFNRFLIGTQMEFHLISYRIRLTC